MERVYCCSGSYDALLDHGPDRIATFFFCLAVAIPDYAIALIVVGLLIFLALIFCLGGICLACSNTKGKDSKSPRCI